VSRAKGTGFLLEAAKHLANEKIEIKLVGNIIDLQEQITSLSDVVTAVGHVSYSDIVKYYQWADVFCFPSCFEGSASVTYEALACGLPVITTVNAGSVVRHGIDGFIIPVGCAQSVYDAIKQYLDRPELLGVHRDNVLDNRLLLGADGYRQRLTDFIIHIENGIIN
jgi:glycosyltransferase involved in cell wall biosynthesis